MKVIHLVLLILCAVLSGCLRNTATPEEKDNYQVPDLLVDTETYWPAQAFLSPQRDGLMSANLSAVMDAQDRIHVIYYEATEEKNEHAQALYNLQYRVWHTQSRQWLTESAETIVQSYHTDRISLALDAQGKPFVSFRGGNAKACNGGVVESDAMFATKEGDAWQVYQGAIGYVERSAGPLLDGHAGGKAHIALDSAGNVHLIYQFLYEGCDENNFRYPDLFYAQKTPQQFAQDNRRDADIEEQVSGNDYEQGGNYQNTTGYVADLIINQDDQPLVFYYADHAGALGEGLYMGYREADGSWHTEIVLEGCEVYDVVAGQAENGDLHAFYVVDDCAANVSRYEDDRFVLMHSTKRATANGNTDQSLTEPEAATAKWQTGYVINQVYVGGIHRHLAMTFNRFNQPQVAFYELQTYAGNELKNLVSVALNEAGTQYLRSDVAKWQDIGQYSQMLTDSQGDVYVISYDTLRHGYYLFKQGNQH